MTGKSLAGIVSAGMAAACLMLPGAGHADSVIRNVTLVDTVTGALTRGQALVIRDGRIAAVLPEAEVAPAEGDPVIDGAGAFVVPGYNDMHAHALVPDAPAAPQDGDHVHAEPASQAVISALYLANGVTGFRQMSGSAGHIDAARALNAAIAAGEILSPQVLQVTGDIMAGQIATPEAGLAFVEAQAASGADFLKIVGGRPDVVLAMVRRAAELDLPVAGHLPPALSSAELSGIGWQAVEHLGATPGMMLDCAAAAPQIRARMAEAGPPPALPPTFLLSPMLYTGPLLSPALAAILGTFQPEVCADLIARFAENGTWQVPTLIRLQTMAASGAEGFRQDPRLRYLAPADRALWQQLGAEFAQRIPPEMQQVFDAFFALQQRVTGEMAAAGLPLLAGSDLGGIWILPGFGLQDEFAALSRAGLTPLQVLQSTTLNAAAFLGREAEMGQIAEGFAADLVLLDGNPLEDAAHLGAIRGVMRAGTYLDRAALDAMLAEVAQAYVE